MGSSNISNPALTDGLEWNVKLCQQESGHLWEKINATFETYLRSREFEPVSLEFLPRLERADGKNILAWFHDRICSEIRLPDGWQWHDQSPFFC
ncbi:hypothetical protein [Desulfobacula sp.]|uniref:hypothetical protein n=1 Tax=Desulfobacula sp. TaxID=2593537 RepID=UPI0026122A02|nr:hypothetical protein [Desulfobacula sp.]